MTLMMNFINQSKI